MTYVKKRGSAQIGWCSESWPFATIEVSADRLVIESMGTYVFTSHEVNAVEAVGSIPFFSQSIQIHHSNALYPEKIIFYPIFQSATILDAAREAGFRIGRPTQQTKRGIPVRPATLIAATVIWYLLMLLDMFVSQPPPGSVGPFGLIALAGVFVLAVLLPGSLRLQALFLRDGRNIGEVANFLRGLQFVSAAMLCAFGILPLAK
jgi:hypothetical protein